LTWIRKAWPTLMEYCLCW